MPSVYPFMGVRRARPSAVHGLPSGAILSLREPRSGDVLERFLVEADDAAEWTILADNGGLGLGGVGLTGNVTPWASYAPVIAFPPDPLCPPVTYYLELSSYYIPSNLSPGTAGQEVILSSPGLVTAPTQRGHVEDTRPYIAIRSPEPWRTTATTPRPAPTQTAAARAAR